MLLTWQLLEQTAEDELWAGSPCSTASPRPISAPWSGRRCSPSTSSASHALAEAGEPLTLDVLNDIYGELYEVYTPGVAIDDGVRVNWGRIPHFYRAFYVYQYATGLSAAIAIARAIRDEGEPARERYRRCSPPAAATIRWRCLREAGVDLTSPEPIEAGLAEFEAMVSEMEQIVASGVVEQPAPAN